MIFFFTFSRYDEGISGLLYDSASLTVTRGAPDLQLALERVLLFSMCAMIVYKH
jgi:hypothetical protein